MNRETVSIIIPVLNEEKRIGPLLDYLHEHFPTAELIVVDGHSDDRTVAIASLKANSFRTFRGRGRQLNFGAGKASGSILWFVHADCIPHPESESALRTALTDREVIGGAFQYGFDSSRSFFRFFSSLSNLKNRLKNVVYGDMGIFVRANMFTAMGGYGEDLLMEDFEFGRRLKKFGRVIILDKKIVTSTRDWKRRGVLHKTIKDSFIKIAYRAGVSNNTLYRWYYGRAE